MEPKVAAREVLQKGQDELRGFWGHLEPEEAGCLKSFLKRFQDICFKIQNF